MKYTILGFNQQKLLEYGLDLVDAQILRYFIDFKDSGAMSMQIFNNKPYYWIKYDSLIESIPVIRIGSKDALRRRLKKLEDCGILDHYHKKEGGSYSFYGVGVNYRALITSPAIQESEGYDLKIGGGTTQKSEGYHSKVGGGTTQKSEQNINLLKDSSIKDSSIKNIVEYLNSKAGTRYKYTTPKTKQLINARFKEGFLEEQFLKVIDIKCKEWMGTDFQKYLRPETLFGTKFENYLNQKNGSRVISGKESTFNNFDQRTYDFDDLERKLLGWDR